MKTHLQNAIAHSPSPAAALRRRDRRIGSSGPAKGRTLFRYSGRLVADPASDANSISVSVETGNKRALRSLLGAARTQAFAVGSHTEFLRWSNGVPHVVSIDDLQQGDWVTVNVRAPRGADLAEIEATPAGIVADRGATPSFAKLPLWLFRGTLSRLGRRRQARRST